MSNLPRWNDDFSTDPLSDPKYIASGLITYNAVDDRIELEDGNIIEESFTLLDSINSTGSLETEMQHVLVGGNRTKFMFCEAFGYMFVVGHWFNGTDKTAILPEGSSLADDASVESGSIFRIQEGQAGPFTLKIIASPTGVQFFIDDVLFFVAPARVVLRNLNFGFAHLGGSGTFLGGPDFVSNIDLKSDGSLPKQPTITEPSPAGSINALQEILSTVPESRLYIDIGAHAPGITGVTSVVWDPLGVKTGPVAMAEDTGIPDGSGDTTGDFFLEIPANGVASDNRIVFKEDFVTTNSVAPGDAVDYNVLPSPAAQTDNIAEEDDLQCFFTMSDDQDVANKEFVSLGEDLDILPQVHNFNADGNLGFLFAGTHSNLFDGLAYGSSQGNYLEYNSSVTFPILVDIDLGKEYNIRSFGLQSRNFSDSGDMTTNCDIYSNTVPFVGSGLGQGTLRESNYPVDAISVGSFIPGTTPGDIPISPDINIKARFWRFVIVDAATDTTAAGPGIPVRLRTFGEIDVRINIDNLDSLNDNAQFLHRPAAGGAFVAFPGAGVTQGDGQVKITLPAGIQLSSDQRRFIAVKYKADLTD